jgi:two-component system, NtrC family, nitrogen regulation sensor histidine kinase NtrY
VAGYYYFMKPVSHEQVAKLMSARLDNVLTELNNEAKEILTQNQNSPRVTLPDHSKFQFYVFDRGEIVAWSDHTFIPSSSAVSDTFMLKHIKYGGSDYLMRKWVISNQRFLIAAIPLIRRYTITNDYLRPEWNRDIFPSANIDILETIAEKGEAVCADGRCPFKIDFVASELKIHSWARTLAFVFSLGVIALAIFLLMKQVRKLNTPDIGFVALAIALFALRVVMPLVEYPASLVPGALFDPQVFAASALNPSLGDLLLNEIVLFILCIYLFKNAFHFRVVRWMNLRKTTSWLLSVISGFFVLLAMLFPFVVIQTLYNNSAIVLDLSESLEFDALRVTAFVIVLLAGLSSFLFSHAFLRLLIGDGGKLRIIISFIIAIGIFAAINTYTGQHYVSSLLMASAYLFVVYLLRLYSSLRRLGFATFTYLFVTIFFFSLNAAFAIYHFSRIEKMDSQFRFARNFLIDRDYFAEYLLRELSTEISSDAFIQHRLNTPFLSKDAVRQKIRQVFLSNYFNKYDISIYIFSGNNDASDNRSDITLLNLLTQYDKDAYRTEYKGVFYVSSPAADVTQKYLVVVPILKSNIPSSHIVVELSLKKVIPENVYPELLVDNRFLQFYRSREVSYGVYVNDRLSYSSGSFNYDRFNKNWFGDPQLHTRGISEGGFDHIGQEDENGRIAIVSARSIPYDNALANFSFLLVLGLITILVFIVIQGIRNYWSGDPLYFSARIQLFFNLAFFLPLITVSIMTLWLTTRSSQDQINDEYLNKTKKFSEQIAIELTQQGVSSLEETRSLENKLTDLAQLANLDANIYSARGILSATSQPQIFESSLLSSYVNPVAFSKIIGGQTLFIVDEQAGRLRYHTAYAAIKAPATGSLLGVLGIPFFQSSYSLERVQVNLLSNILNIFAAIFILLVVLSYVVTRWLTFPLRFITQSLRRTSLTRVNQPLVWKSDDEIGLMVKEYNQMLFKLSESKAELEQTQRERAWRDIAQQVAHEIKNPLTPMKLTLQQLERNIQSGNNVPEKTQKAVASLLIQVNTLDEIASSFSSFAKMPEPVMKPLELVSLLKRITDLHGHSGQINMNIAIREILVNGDEQLLGRTFSNIILNAFQATIPGEAVVVDIIVKEEHNRVTIQFRDYGRGMEPHVAERIFLPHFTTKKSGSGLGLAIAKQGIEQMKGQIWFETKPGEGTSFFISLPVFK